MKQHGKRPDGNRERSRGITLIWILDEVDFGG